MNEASQSAELRIAKTPLFKSVPKVHIGKYVKTYVLHGSSGEANVSCFQGRLGSGSFSFTHSLIAALRIFVLYLLLGKGIGPLMLSKRGCLKTFVEYSVKAFMQ